MKRITLATLLTFVALSAIGQDEWEINFEDTVTLSKVYIDTLSNPNNVWQIGPPNKNTFELANSIPNCIVTDTADSYPPNDTSSFVVIHEASGAWDINYPNIVIGGYYNVNSDSLTDYGFIDFSVDLGGTWHRVDSADVICSWSNPVLPTLTGNSDGWRFFNYCLDAPTTVNYGDTVLYRFTFISDSVQTNKDGLMFDDLHFVDWAEGVNDFESVKSTVYPNPSNESITIEMQNQTNSEVNVRVTDAMGRLVYFDSTNHERVQLSVMDYQDGVYYYRVDIDARSEQAWGKFVVKHD